LTEKKGREMGQPITKSLGAEGVRGQAGAEQLDRELQKRIGQALQEIRYGTVTLVIQDGRVIQIDKSEKIRLK
jgi:hypothetical protein